MKLLILDELFGKREPLMNEFIARVKPVIVSDPQHDIASLPHREAVEVLGFSSSFYDWQLPVAVLSLFPSLRTLCISGGWHEHIDLDYCSARGLTVSYIPDFCGDSAAEWCVMSALLLARHVLPFTVENRLSMRSHCGVELLHKKAAVLGLGSVGKALLPKLNGLGMSTVYWSRKTRDDRYVYLGIDDCIRSADFLFVTVYDGGEMTGLLDEHRLQMLDPHSYLISGLGSQPALEGTTVDWHKAIEMVMSGKLAGLALECGEEDKCPSYASNIHIAPGHTGWLTEDSFQRQTSAWAEAMENALTGHFKTQYLLLPRGIPCDH